MEKEVNDLITKAAASYDAGDAMRWSQAALNAANALCALNTAKKSESK